MPIGSPDILHQACPSVLYFFWSLSSVFFFLAYLPPYGAHTYTTPPNNTDQHPPYRRTPAAPRAHPWFDLQSIFKMGWVENATPEVNAISEWPKIMTICIVFSVVSTAIVCARIWIRFTNHGLAADDYMAVLSMVFAIAYAVMCIVRTLDIQLPLRSCALVPWLTCLLLLLCRNEIRPGSSAGPASQGKPRPLHPHQLCRPAHLSNGHQLLQGCPTDQLPAALQRDEPCHLPQGRLDYHGCHLGGTLGLLTNPHLCVPSGKSRDPKTRPSGRETVVTFSNGRSAYIFWAISWLCIGTQVVGSVCGRKMSGTWSLVHRLCHRDHRIRHRGCHHPDSRTAQAQGPHSQENRPDRHLSLGSLHDSLFHLPVPAD